MGNPTTRRTSVSIEVGVNREEDARKANKIKAAVSTLSQKEGFKGFSLFFYPSPEDKARYPAL